MITKEQVIQMMWKERGKAGSWGKLAERIGCSPAYLSDIISGNRNPGPIVLLYLKLVKVDDRYDYYEG